MKQLDLFGPATPLFEATEPVETDGGWDDEDEYDAGPLTSSDPELCAAFEEYLRKTGCPYVAVDEAKRAIFAHGIDAFDFLVYSNSGPNLLVLVRGGSDTDDRHDPDERESYEADIDLLAEWEKVFGRDFVGAFVFPSANGWRCVTRQDFGLPMNAHHARPLGEFL